VYSSHLDRLGVRYWIGQSHCCAGRICRSALSFSTWLLWTVWRPTACNRGG
jgi:hypothetical protein